MRTHNLKILPEYFNPVLERKKNFEIRFNDCDFQVGDYIVLHEYNSETNAYTGQSVIGRITYITDFNQKQGFVVFSFEIIKQK